MEKIVFIKLCPHIDLAHLYEHLWCAQMTRLLRQHKLFEYLDYFLEAVTFNTGFIYIEVYSSAANEKTIRKCFHEVAIDISEESVFTAMGQVMAEKQLATSGEMRDIISSLSALHAQPWTENKNFDVYDNRSIRRTPQGFYFIEKRIRTTIITTTISLPKECLATGNEMRPLLPLFYTLAYTLNYTIRRILSDKYGFYSYSDSFGTTSQGAKLTNRFRVESAEFSGLTTHLETICQAFNADIEDGLITHIAGVLNDPGYTAKTYRMDESIIYKHTGILIGGAGWQKYATEENIIRLLNAASLTLSAGRIKQEMSLRTILGG